MTHFSLVLLKELEVGFNLKLGNWMYVTHARNAVLVII